MGRDKFDESIDKELLENDFANYDDWEYGPVSGYSTGHERYSLYLMRHDFGYWLIISAHQSGENPRMNIGSSNNAQEIINIRDSLRNLW
jgi:hypothetical protein